MKRYRLMVVLGLFLVLISFFVPRVSQVVMTSGIWVLGIGLNNIYRPFSKKHSMPKVGAKLVYKSVKPYHFKDWTFVVRGHYHPVYGESVILGFIDPESGKITCESSYDWLKIEMDYELI